MFRLQAQTALDLKPYFFEVDDLADEMFVSFTNEKLKNSQFVFVGEQHGIKEVGLFTNVLYNLGQEFDYKTLCIETDAVAALKIKEAAKSNYVSSARKMHGVWPNSIPFYENEDDAILFENVVKKGGEIWGIDQTLMTQFRMNFDYLSKITSSKKLKSRLSELIKVAEAAYKETIETKNFGAPYLFKYDVTTHQELLGLAIKEEEKEVIEQLWKTKEIYGYYATRENYLNNYVRGQLMKSNFMRYYRAAEMKEKTPKVIFKLGANHAAIGLTRTNIYDISNMGSELAQSNGFGSVHYMVMGISGETAVGNPLAPNPTATFDNIGQFPEEVQSLAKAAEKKYFVMDLALLRKQGYSKSISAEFKNLIFAYDVLVLVNNAEALKTFKRG